MAHNHEFVVTLRDIYDELRILQDKVSAMTPQSKTLADHENRLRLLERWRYALPGSIMLALASVTITIWEAFR